MDIQFWNSSNTFHARKEFHSSKKPNISQATPPPKKKKHPKYQTQPKQKIKTNPKHFEIPFQWSTSEEKLSAKITLGII